MIRGHTSKWFVDQLKLIASLQSGDLGNDPHKRLGHCVLQKRYVRS